MKMVEGLPEEKLMVTVTLAGAWIYPEANNYPKTIDDIAEMTFKCYEEGASIAHVHAPKDAWAQTMKAIKEKCDIIVQAGMSSYPIEKRQDIFKSKPEMISIILNHHDEYFAGLEVNQIHQKKELEEYCKVCRKTRIKPEFEEWHYGSVWNLNYLIEKNLLDKPYFLTLFLGWPGGTWSPPTPDEYLHRIKYLPENCICSTSVMGPNRDIILPLSIAMGGHVRIGTEDYPYLKRGVLAKDNAELVRKIVMISKEMGREVADSSEARKIIGIK